MLNFLWITIQKYFNNYKGLPKICWLGFLLIFIDAVAGGIIFFLSIYFVNNLALSIKIAGFIISSYGFGTVMGSLIGGKLSDTILPHIVVKISLLLQAMGFIALIYLHSVFILAINLFIIGISAYSFKTSINCWILHHAQQQSELRLKILNIMRVASNAGLGISGTIIGLFAKNHFSLLLILSGVIFFISAVIFVTNSGTPEAENIQHISSDVESKSFTYNKKVLLVILIFVFFIGIMIAQLGTTYPIFIQNTFKELGIQAVSILFILDTLLIVIFQAPLVNLLKKANKILFTGIGGFLMGFGMLILNVSSFFYLAIISCVLWTTGEMLFIPLAQLICYEKGLKKNQGKRIGAYQAVYAFGTICGPVFCSQIYFYYGSEMLWYAFGVVGICCFLVCNYFKKYA